ncbi:MAG: CvpA family protein [Oscillospiraceae bacterium]|nr:CvpA family protein [Oscillospiraceae bacterium]
MDNAFIADAVIVLILAAGALIGAKRGLIKSLMGVFVVVGALVGAVTLADMLTDPLTDALSARIENDLVSSFSDALGSREEGVDNASEENLAKQLERFGISRETLDELLDGVVDVIHGMKTLADETATERFRSAVGSGVRSTVRSVVHSALVLGGFLLLTVVLGLFARLLDRVFDLPLLDLTNSVGGAMMGLLEAGATVFVLLFFASHFGVTAIMDCAEGSRLMPYFLLRKSVWILPAVESAAGSAALGLP